MVLVRALVVLLLAVCASDAAAQGRRDAPVDPGSGRTPIQVVLPDPDNLQYLTFWGAAGAGFFEAEGFDIRTSAPPFPNGVIDLLRKENAPVAVLPPPIYLQLIAERSPIRIVANLLSNDGINLIVKR